MKDGGSFLSAMFHPESVVVYGASGPLKMGTMQALAMIDSGFPGKVYYVHPKEDTVLGEPVYRKAVDIPGKIDLGLLVIPAAAIPGALDDLGQKGVKSVVVTTAGFKEVETEEGEKLHDLMIETARRHGIRFVGPNCLGLVNAHLPLNTTTFPARLEKGDISIASHSGSYATQIFPYMKDLEPGLGLRYVISLGNEADIDVVDALDCFRKDPETKAVVLYLEGIRRGKEFVRAALETSLIKPVVAHYIGGNSTGARAGASHTASLGMPDDLADGMFRQCGVIRAGGVEEMFDFARVLSQAPPMKGKRVAVITNSGGPGATASYVLGKEGLEMPEPSGDLKQKLSASAPPTSSFRNPMDFTFDTDFNRFHRTVETLLRSDEYDAVLAYGLFVSGFFEQRKEGMEKFFPQIPVESVIAGMRGLVGAVAKLPGRIGKPMVAGSLMGPLEDGFQVFTDNRSPIYPTPERAARALGALARYWEWRSSKQKD